MAVICDAATFPDYPVKPASEYVNTVSQSGLTVAVNPVEDRQEQRKYFGLDLRLKGFVPVFLVIENRTSDVSFLLRKNGLMYSPSARSGSSLPNPAVRSKADKTIAVIGAVPTIYTFMATVVASKTREQKQTLLRSELQSTTISPGASVHGFVFLPARPAYSSRDRIHLTVPFTRLGTDEIVVAESEF